MADRSLKNLNYGHYGTTSYDVDDRDWLFARCPSQSHFKEVKQQQSARAVQDPESDFLAHHTSGQPSLTGTSIKKAFRNLAHNFPQAVASVEHIQESALTSQAIVATTSVYDPCVGNFLSFGSIAFEGHHNHPRRVAAIPSGEAGNILKLAILTRERHGWGMDRSVWVEGPSLSGNDCGYWNEEATPIQQVCFAQSTDRSTFLAVRLPKRTVLLRPTYNRANRLPRRSPFHSLPSSIIDPHPILNVSQIQTGGAPHADVTFNPDYQLQFAIVDRNGTWSVWDVESGRKDRPYTTSCIRMGSLKLQEEVKVDGEDTWARVLWVKDVNTLLVCNRRLLHIVNISEQSSQHFSRASIIDERSSDWILDVKVDPRNRNQFFVLTSSRLLLMAAYGSEETHNSANRQGARIVLSRSHFRGVEDFTLNFSVQGVSDTETCLILHSRLNQLVQIYIFKQDSDTSIAAVQSVDPSELRMTSSTTKQIIQTHIEPMQFRDLGLDKDGLALGRFYIQRGVKFYRLHIVLSDLQVHSTVVYASDTGTMSQAGQVVESFGWNRVKQSRKHKFTPNEESSFVAPNGPVAFRDTLLRSKLQTSIDGQLHDKHPARYTDHALLYYDLVHSNRGSEELPDAVDSLDLIKQFEQFLGGDTDSSWTLSRTMYESVPAHDEVAADNFARMDLAATPVTVSDVDDTSTELQALFLSRSTSRASGAQWLASASVLGLSDGEECSISHLYDNILQHWVAPLPAHVSAPFRKHKERLTRRLAAEVILASSCIKARDSEGQDTNKQVASAESDNLSLPVLPSRPVDSSQTQMSGAASSQSSFPSSLPTIHSSPPPEPSRAALPPTVSDPLTRLKMHLQFREASAASIELLPAVTQILTHWELGIDPQRYDFSASNTAQQRAEDEQLNEEQQGKDQKKMLKRAERKKQREASRSQAQSISQPAIFPRSSPGPAFPSSQVQPQIQVQSQTQTQFSGPDGNDLLAPMSQIEPGRFGGRPDKKKKKKSRISGF